MFPPAPMPLMWISHAEKHTQHIGLTATVCLPAKIQDAGHVQHKGGKQNPFEPKSNNHTELWWVVQMQHECVWGSNYMTPKMS